ncbi:hypothetical protein ACOSP7_021411 [Xanthoceras sorbifolium]
MENEDMMNSIWNSNGSSSSSIGKEKIVSKGVRVGGKKGSKKSDCWKSFDEYFSNDGKKRVRCKYCGVSYGFGSGASTTNMNTHMKTRCTKYQAIVVDENQKMLVKQKTVDGYGNNLGLANFSAEECRRALAEMLVLDELPFRFVENQGFRRFCQVACPKFEIPSRRTIVRDLYKLYVDEKAKLKNYFSRSKERVCLTTDTWTSVQNINYMVITCHFIDYEWRLQKRILSFSQIVDHSGDSIGRCIEEVLLEWGIDKVFTITVDNATANATAMSYVRRKLNSWQLDGAILGGKYLHVRCCAHILNLIVSDGLKDLHESVVAIRNAVKYVKSSPSRLDIFRRCVTHEKITSNGLVVLDVPTRWNSTFLMLESAVKLVRAFQRLEDDDGHYVRYFQENENGTKRIGPPTFDDWDNAKVFIHFLATFYDITLEFSASLHVTSNIFVKSWCAILEQLTSLSTTSNPLVSKMALSMKQKFDKYWGGLDKTNHLLIVAVVLDPRYKIGYVKFRFDEFYGKEQSKVMLENLKVVMNELYVSYRILYGGRLGVGVMETNEGGVSTTGVDSDLLGGSMSLASIRKATDREDSKWKTYQEEEDTSECQNELELYLMENCVKFNDRFDILAWWKNSIAKFPILSPIAKDVFAMPISTVASESAFSTGGRILDPFRSSLTPKMVEGLILTGNWLQANHPIAEPHVIQEHARNDDTFVDMLEHYLHVQTEIDNASGVICVPLEDN